MPLHINPKKQRAWLRYTSARAEQPTSTCRPPTPIERLAAHGFTRRASTGLVWFQHADGRETPKRETIAAAVRAALEEL